MGDMAELGRSGIVFSGQEPPQTEYLFTRLNELKPGKIRSASQGQFSIEPRDRSTPHIKKVRVVSTVEYYLSD